MLIHFFNVTSAHQQFVARHFEALATASMFDLLQLQNVLQRKKLKKKKNIFRNVMLQSEIN